MATGKRTFTRHPTTVSLVEKKRLTDWHDMTYQG